MTCEKWPSCGEVRKNHWKPRLVSGGDEDSALRKGTPWRSATWLAVAVTFECQQQTIAATFSCVISRSASAWPISGLPWWSAKISRTLAPLRPGRPLSRW